MTAVGALAQLLVREIFRKKDFYVALVVIALVVGLAARLEFYQMENIVRYLMEIGLALIFFISVFLTVSLAARQFPAEVEDRTLEVLLAKPVRRIEYVLGKFLGSIAAGGATFLIFYLLFLAIVRLRAESLSIPMAFQTAALFFLNLTIVAAMSGALSYYLTRAANVTVSLVVYILISTTGASLRQSLGGFYYVLPHFEFFDLRQRFIHGFEPIPWKLFGFLVFYAALYVFIFISIGWMRLRKKPLH